MGEGVSVSQTCLRMSSSLADYRWENIITSLVMPRIQGEQGLGDVITRAWLGDNAHQVLHLIIITSAFLRFELALYPCK